MSALTRLLRFVFVMAAAVAVMAGTLAFAAPRVGDLVSAHRSDHEQITLKPLAERSYIYDRDGNLQGTMTNRDDPQNRSQVALEEIPETVVGSVLAMEDAGFYEHSGVNVRAILRAVDANLESGEVSQGGSTITQQVVKNSLVGDDQSLSRKLREAFLAVELEKQMTKDEILEYYLNSVYFGGGAYGVQAASEYYFRKDVGELSWAEGALLASLIRSPNLNNPFLNAERSQRQRSVAFARLEATDRLTADEVAVYEHVPLPTNPNRPAPPYDYFVEEVKQQLLTDPRFGLGATEAARHRLVYEGGIRVHTTFDQRLQVHALAARNETMPGNKGDATFDVVNPEDGQLTFGTQAIASIDPSTGAVRVMVGGPGFDKYQLNLATSVRQPGSTMKTFVAASLFEQEFVPADTVSGGGSCSFKFPGEDEVKSYRGRGGTIASVIAASSNCAFMKLGQVAGVVEVADVANRLGIKSSLFMTSDGEPTAPPNNLPLGTKEVSPLEMASAYATLANDGVYHEPYFIERIEDRDGRVLYQHRPDPVRAVDVEVARQVTDILTGVVDGGTGGRARIAGGQPAAGKTGTTDDSADVWFVGYTPQLSTAVWMGAPKGRISLTASNRELAGATGGRFPAATWGHFYTAIMAGEPIVEFEAPKPTRRGRWVGRVPNEIGGSSGTTRPRRTSPPAVTTEPIGETPAGEDPPPDPNPQPPAPDPDPPEQPTQNQPLPGGT